MSSDAIKQFYEAHGLRGKSGFGSRPAIVVVDLNLGFTDLKSKLAGNFDELMGHLTKLLSRGRELKIPIIFTTIAYDDLVEGGAYLQKVPALREFMEGSPWVQLDPRLGRLPSEPIITKRFASAFFGTTLCSILATSGVDTVVVTGVTTSGCVRATAVDAMQYGYKVVVPIECVGDRAEEPHFANLFDLDAKYADVVPLKEILDHLK